jgi:hypothetical protein
MPIASQEPDELFSKKLHALLEIEANELQPSRVANGSLFSSTSYVLRCPVNPYVRIPL